MYRLTVRPIRRFLLIEIIPLDMHFSRHNDDFLDDIRWSIRKIIRQLHWIGSYRTHMICKFIRERERRII